MEAVSAQTLSSGEEKAIGPLRAAYDRIPANDDKEPAMPTIEEDLRFLITELQEERTNTGDELATCPIPGTFGEAWDLFRALCNTRLPEHVSGEFLAKQDKLLHAIIDEEGITYAGLTPPCESNPRIAVDTVRAWLDANPKADMHVIFDVYTEQDEQTYREILGE